MLLLSVVNPHHHRLRHQHLTAQQRRSRSRLVLTLVEAARIGVRVVVMPVGLNVFVVVALALGQLLSVYPCSSSPPTGLFPFLPLLPAVAGVVGVSCSQRRHSCCSWTWGGRNEWLRVGLRHALGSTAAAAAAVLTTEGASCLKQNVTKEIPRVAAVCPHPCLSSYCSSPRLLVRLTDRV